VAMVNAARILVNADERGKRKTGKGKSRFESGKQENLTFFFSGFLLFRSDSEFNSSKFTVSQGAETVEAAVSAAAIDLAGDTPATTARCKLEFF